MKLFRYIIVIALLMHSTYAFCTVYYTSVSNDKNPSIKNIIRIAENCAKYSGNTVNIKDADEFICTLGSIHSRPTRENLIKIVMYPLHAKISTIIKIEKCSPYNNSPKINECNLYIDNKNDSENAHYKTNLKMDYIKLRGYGKILFHKSSTLPIAGYINITARDKSVFDEIHNKNSHSFDEAFAVQP